MRAEIFNKDNILNLEKKIYELTEFNNKFLKEKKSLDVASENLNDEIETKRGNIVKYMKNLSDSSRSIKKDGTTLINKKANLYLLDEQILKLFNSIQRNCISTLQEKYKSQIEHLFNMQKQMKICYMMIKKLEINEEFLAANKMVEANNLFDNLKNIAKVGRLNYYSLKQCGPILIFRISLLSTFDEIHQKSCEIWGLNSSTYCLYDDSFNSLECCLNSKLNEFFYSYRSSDNTIGPGQVCFYLIEKLKNQKEMLEMHEKSIDSKAESSEDNSNKAGILAGNEFENCMEFIKSGKILKGINNFKSQKIDINKRYLNVAQMIDNNIIFIIINLIIIILSVLTIGAKKDINNWNFANLEAKMLLNSNFAKDLSDMSFLIKYSASFVDLNNPLNSIVNTTDFIFFGPIRFRFFITNTFDCFKYYKSNTLFDDSLIGSLFKCYYTDHVGENRSKNASILNYKFKNETETNITHYLSTQIGEIDQSGIIMDTWSDPGNTVNYNMFFKDIYSIANKSSYVDNIQGFELTYNLYDANLDVFVAFLLVVQRDIDNSAQITVVQTIPFKTSIYEKSSDAIYYKLDLARLLLTSAMLLLIPFRTIQKYTNSDVKGCLILMKKFLTNLFIVKNMLLISSFTFLTIAFGNYNNNYINTQKYYDSRYFIDLYQFALDQRLARNLDIISFYFISIYSLKYLQYVETIQPILISFKKAAFEYFTLFLTIAILFIGLSFLTCYVFGSFIFEYKNFFDSLIMNMKIFIYVDNGNVTTQFIEYYRIFSIVILVIFIFLIRLFLLNLFYPIFLDYYRIEIEKLNMSKSDKNEHEDNLTFYDKLSYLFFPFQKDRKKNKKVEDINRDNEDMA